METLSGLNSYIVIQIVSNFFYHCPRQADQTICIINMLHISKPPGESKSMVKKIVKVGVAK